MPLGLMKQVSLSLNLLTNVTEAVMEEAFEIAKHEKHKIYTPTLAQFYEYEK